MKINRKLTIKQLIKKLGYTEYINEDVLITLKNEGPKEGEVELFNLGKDATNAEVLQEYEKRNLEPDMGAILTYLIENPKLLDEKSYIGIQFEDNVFALFLRWSGERSVGVSRDGGYWLGSVWLAGRRKSSVLKSSKLSDTLSFDLRIKSLEEQMKKLHTILNF